MYPLNMCAKKLVLLLSMVTAAHVSYARWIDENQADVVIQSINVDIAVNADGSSQKITDVIYEIKNESAKRYFKNFAMPYCSGRTKLEVLEADATTENAHYAINPVNITQDTLSPPMDGFDGLVQINIPFPKIEIGSTVHLKIKDTTKYGYLDGAYFANLRIGTSGRITEFWKTATTKIRSQLPLYLHVNDPHNVLRVKKDAGAQTAKTIEIELLRPISSDLSHETNYTCINPKKYTNITISSMPSWQDEFFGAHIQGIHCI